MNHTPQIKRAIQFAARKHHGQFRKEREPLPYITHLFSVALLVAEDGAEDDVVTAALLHDVIEDTPTSREEVAEAFNERVALLVQSVSEPKGEAWRERKESYLATLRNAPVEAVVISLADKIDNIESKIEAHEREGDRIHDSWRQPKEEYLWFHGEVLAIGRERLPEHRLTKRLADVHARERALWS